MFITASKDYTAKVWCNGCWNVCLLTDLCVHLQLLDGERMELLKTYRTERPVNSASISPLRDHVRTRGCVWS